jgi:DNA-binding transcriptional ArsR family regulator
VSTSVPAGAGRAARVPRPWPGDRSPRATSISDRNSSQVRKVAAALGDELCLRILRVVMDEQLSASEIADRLGVDRTSLHHHLGILRSAGLLSIRDDGVQGWRYMLRDDGFEEIRPVAFGLPATREAEYGCAHGPRCPGGPQPVVLRPRESDSRS